MGNASDAKGLVHQSNVGDIAPKAPTPGRAPLPQGPTGDPYSDHGAVCDGKAGNGCLLTDAQRARLVGQFQQRVGKAALNYVAAATAVRVDKLVQKPDTDVHWLASLLLDLVAGHVVGKLAKTIVTFKSSVKLGDAVKALDVSQFDIYDSSGVDSLDLSSFSSPSWQQRARSAVLDLKEDTVKTGVKHAVDGAKKVGLAVRQQNISDAHGSKQSQQLSYLDQLMDSATIGFTRISEQTPAVANDVELIALFHAMAPEHHLPSTYKAEISAKVDRFMKSGVNKIGVHNAARSALPGEDVHNPKGPSTAVIRHTRVAWREYVSGHPKDLVYEHMDGKRDLASISPGEPGHPSQPAGPRAFGPRRAISKEAERGDVVPAEFHEAALARHQATWNEAPQTLVMDDSLFHWDPARVEKAKQAKRAKSTPVPSITLFGSLKQKFQQAQQAQAQQQAASSTPMMDVHDFSKAPAPVHDFTKGAAPPPKPTDSGPAPSFMWQDIHDFTKKDGS